MAVLRLLFWNVGNLFEAGAVARGPQSPAELDARIERLATVIASVSPNVVVLAEVQNNALFTRLRQALPKQYENALWVDGPPAGSTIGTGLGVFADETLDDLQHVETWRPTPFSRPRAVLMQASLSRGGSFVLVANHWKSRMEHSGAPPSSLDRNETASWLGEQLATYDKTDCAVVVGDFNAQPWEPAFGDFRLQSQRAFSGALWAGSTASPARLYTTAWRFAAEPTYWDHRQPGYREPRPKTTHDGSPALFDQLLVSRSALKNGPLTLIESSLRCVQTGHTARHTRSGTLLPRRWEWDAATGLGVGASDHFPLYAEFAL